MSADSMAAALALQLRALGGLEAWGPAAALAERVTTALRGDGPLEVLDLRRLSVWSASWALVGPEARAFYGAALTAPLAHADAVAVEMGLLALLEGTQASPVTRGRLSRLHVEITGRESGHDLTARPRRTRRT